MLEDMGYFNYYQSLNGILVTHQSFTAHSWAWLLCETSYICDFEYSWLCVLSILLYNVNSKRAVIANTTLIIFPTLSLSLQLPRIFHPDLNETPRDPSLEALSFLVVFFVLHNFWSGDSFWTPIKFIFRTTEENN